MSTCCPSLTSLLYWVAPLSTETYSYTLDLVLLVYVNVLSFTALLVTQYVNVILVRSVDEIEIIRVKQTTFSTSPELVSSVEEPIDNCLQYLDSGLQVSRGLCWSYEMLSPKQLLSANSLEPPTL